MLWQALEKAPFLLKDRADMQVHHGEAASVTRECKKAATSEANLLNFNQQTNLPLEFIGYQKRIK